jgi:alkylhydroperoxidase family enzyme
VLSGRGVGLNDDQIARLLDDPPPEDVFDPVERLVVSYAQRLTRLELIDDELYSGLAQHFSAPALIELCFIVGTAIMVNRFHATFRTDVEAATTDTLSTSCPVTIPPPPTG